MASDSMEYEDTWEHYQPPSAPPEVCYGATPDAHHHRVVTHTTVESAPGIWHYTCLPIVMYLVYISPQICFVNWGWHLEKLTTITNLTKPTRR